MIRRRQSERLEVTLNAAVSKVESHSLCPRRELLLSAFLIETYPRWLGVVGTVFCPQFHFPDAVTRKFTSFKMSADYGVNDVLKVLEICPHVCRECPVARRLLHSGLDASLLTLWNATKPNSCKDKRKMEVVISLLI